MTLTELIEAIDQFKAPDMRDRFAIAALPAVIADARPGYPDSWIAIRAYEIADAMVAEMGDGRAAAAQRDEQP